MITSASVSVPSADSASSRGPASGARLALLVEDEPVFQALIREAFLELGSDWTLLVCETGASAIESLQRAQQPIDLLLVDLGLPDTSGVTVIREARRRSADMPILVTSVHADETHVLDAVRAGARGYLLKDDSAIGIAEAVRRVLAGEYPISPSLARYLFRLAGLQADTAPDAEHTALAPKELELLGLLARGCSYKKAALLMDVALSTVQTYVRRIYQKLEARSKVEAISRARDIGLLD